jgi:hypothetical protein
MTIFREKGGGIGFEPVAGTALDVLIAGLRDAEAPPGGVRMIVSGPKLSHSPMRPTLAHYPRGPDASLEAGIAWNERIIKLLVSRHRHRRSHWRAILP